MLTEGDGRDTAADLIRRDQGAAGQILGCQAGTAERGSDGGPGDIEVRGAAEKTEKIEVVADNIDETIKQNGSAAVQTATSENISNEENGVAEVERKESENVEAVKVVNGSVRRQIKKSSRSNTKGPFGNFNLTF